MERHYIHFYSDAYEWGGHEVLSVKVANAIAADQRYRTSFQYFNQNFSEHLDSVIEREVLPYYSESPFPIIRDRIPFKKNIVTKFLAAKRPNAVFLCSGNIERSLPALYAARDLKIPVLGYLPMAYTQHETNGFAGRIRDLLALPIYQLYSSWITISEAQESLLRRYISANTKVFQLPIPLSWDEIQPPHEPSKQLRITTVGRLFFGQKRQDVIPQLAAKLKSKGILIHFTIIGNGPDKSKLTRLIEHYKVQDCIQLIDWLPMSEMKSFLTNSTDLLLIPSRFEGGPTVLFEALACGLSVLIAKEAYTTGYSLPNWMMFEPNQIDDALQKIICLHKNWNKLEYESSRQRLLQRRTIQDFNETTKQIFSTLLSE